MSQHSKAECAIEYKESLSCLEKKGREACEEFFDAYKDCASSVDRPVLPAPTLTPAHIRSSGRAKEIEGRRERRIAARKQQQQERPTSTR